MQSYIERFKVSLHRPFNISFLAGQTIIPNLFVNTGHGSKGWTLAFGSVKLLADLISNKTGEV